jgi:hypothetical protein
MTMVLARWRICAGAASRPLSVEAASAMIKARRSGGPKYFVRAISPDPRTVSFSNLRPLYHEEGLLSQTRDWMWRTCGRETESMMFAAIRTIGAAVLVTAACSTATSDAVDQAHEIVTIRGQALGFFDEEYLSRFPVAVIERNGEIRGVRQPLARPAADRAVDRSDAASHGCTQERELRIADFTAMPAAGWWPP